MPPEGEEQPAHHGSGKFSLSSISSKASAKMTTLLKDGYKSGQKEAGEEVLDLKHSVGLGHKPNQVPDGKPDINGDQRTIQLGWHPVAGGAGKWFANSLMGKEITKRIGKYPDPTQHWAVIVGDYVHQLWMDESLNVIYFNEKFDPAIWHLFEVGKTRFNDQALRKAGQVTIHLMRDKRPAYNIISNNCQNFATELIDKIQIGAHKEFATALTVYQHATGDHEVFDLWPKHPDDQQKLESDEQEMSKPHRQNTLQVAEQVMDENTTKLDHGDDNEHH